jgi:type III restriction enzyme
MNGKLTLEQKITATLETGNDLPAVPSYISSNLNPEFQLRPYQSEAFGRLLFYLSNERLRQRPSQLLFHMATGSGKTIIMAGAILHLHKLGYRNFLFFVHSTNIIDKTRNNFLNSLSSKYLFAVQVAFRDNKVRIREVDNFQVSSKDDINIAFSTVQALHSRLNNPKENTLTYEDFADQEIVLISDEAHHLNVDTKNGNLTKDEMEEAVSWEDTVNRIFRSNNNNILLEFTATADLSNPNIYQKYFDKHIYDYPLKQFRKEGYSKEVKVLQASVPLMQRALQALILSQYRRKVFEKSRKAIKPVLLFKSKTISESKSFYTAFIDKIKNLKKSDFSPIIKSADATLKRALAYFETNGITLTHLIDELKDDFSPEKCLEINSKEESEDKQIAVNTLESVNNEYRAIFAVEKLNEGWDVLNLFDIVRLYDTRDSKGGKPGRTTISEAQLIGRGARYCPFQITPEQPKYQRKYDQDLENELRICEELYYHSAYNPQYIQELNTALQEIGIKAKETKEIHLQLKLDFTESALYKKGSIFLNECKKINRSEIFSLPSSITQTSYHINLLTGVVQTSSLFETQETNTIEKKTKDYRLVDFGVPILRKAIARLDFYRFDSLKSFLPNVKSVSEFISSKNYLAPITIEVEGPEDHVNNLTPDDKLNITVKVLDSISETMQTEKVVYTGSEEFKPEAIYKVFRNKTLNIFVKEQSDQEYGVPQSTTGNDSLRLDISKKAWYAFDENYGTSEEKYLVKYIDKAYDALKGKYEEIYLVRNEKHFQLYTFKDGKPIEPDFVLFMKKKGADTTLHYQIFIEPKGSHLLKTDAWKEEFLLSLKKKHKIEQLWKSKKYIIWGMPFYNEQERKAEFEKAFSSLK